MQKLLVEHFQAAFAKPPAYWIKAPGKITLFGRTSQAFTGQTLDFALDRHIEMASSPAPDKGRILAIDSGEAMEWEPEAPSAIPENHWSIPLITVIDAFRKLPLPMARMQVAFTGSLPMAASLGAPDALAAALALTLDHVTGANLSAWDLARLCGSPAMASILLARRECALQAKADTNGYLHVPLRTAPYQFLVSHAPQSAWDPGKEEALRTPRGVYANEENQRIRDAEKCLLAGDIARFGDLLNQASRSRARYRPPPRLETRILEEFARASQGAIGNLSVGMGSEIALLSLVHRDSIDEFTASLKKGYHGVFGHDPMIFTCEPSDRAELYELGARPSLARLAV